MGSVNSKDGIAVTDGAVAADGVTVSFVERFARSAPFDQIFKEGMALVEATAGYLDGEGRRAAKALNPALAVIYATESMRLTTRLLEIASWLLMRRALKAGEISPEEARVKRRRIKLATIGRPAHVKGFAELPEGLRLLVDRSFGLNDRIVQLDRALEAPDARLASDAPNPVGAQILQLNAAFAGGRSTRH